MIVPPKLSGRAFKDVGLRCAFRSDTINELVVGVDEREMHLRHEHVRIVPRIADDRGAFAVASDVLSVRSHEELCRIVPLKQVGMSDRSVAVQTFKVQLRRSRIPEPCRVDVRLER